jgi:hypothetical protein
MKIFYKLIIMLMVLFSTYIFISMVINVYLHLPDQHWVRFIIRILILLGIGWFVWIKLNTAPEKDLPRVLITGVITGIIGFCAGFFGPIIFTPEANQGPLLGIFITGPLGNIFGVTGGLIYWNVKSRKDTKEPVNE